MIEAAPQGSLAALIRRLRTRGERMADRRARTLARRARGSGHPWRSAPELWPDLFKDD